jgi:DNA-nicking Smr family endonuclease
MSSGDGKRRRVLSEEERVLWTAVTKTIAPLKDAPPPENVETYAAPLGRRAKQRVARGKEPIDGRLDLHGLTQREAHATLLRFLHTASSRGARLVLVITGKGRVGQSERGVLKRQVPQWLALPEFREWVVGFEDAHISHGGEGALYVRIRRNSRIRE